MYKKKRAQETGSGAAILVIIITISIILYIMFIPPSERQKLLDDVETTKNGKIINGDYEVTTLLSEKPGKLTYLKEKEIEHNIPSFNIYTKTEGIVLKEKNTLYIERELFNEEKANLSFVIKDIENANNLLLSFQSAKNSGFLVIKLNGIEIFNKEITENIVNPIKIPKEHIENENVLEFSTSSIGIAFWSKHEYLLENIKITGDITDVSARTAKTNFIVDEFEKDNLKKVKLRYYPDCTPTEVGTLRIRLNDCKVFTGVPDCNQASIHEMLPYCMSEGENVLEFETEKGHYLIDGIRVRSELKEARDFIYDFHLNSSTYEDIKTEESYVNLTMKFADPNIEKEASIIINGHETVLDTDKLEFGRNIRLFINKGTNIIKILPKEDFYVSELNVELFEKED